jgi:hypothetical protein
MLSLFNVAFVLFIYHCLMLRFVCWIFSSFNVTLCSIELNSVFFFFVLLLDFGKVKVKCCKCAPVGARGQSGSRGVV